jgi:hypothetical protein
MHHLFQFYLPVVTSNFQSYVVFSCCSVSRDNSLHSVRIPSNLVACHHTAQSNTKITVSINMPLWPGFEMSYPLKYDICNFPTCVQNFLKPTSNPIQDPILRLRFTKPPRWKFTTQLIVQLVFRIKIFFSDAKTLYPTTTMALKPHIKKS